MSFHPVTDLNCTSVIRHASTYTFWLEQLGNVHRQTCFYSGNGSSTSAYVSALCETLQWRSSRKKIHLSGSVSQYGLCTTDLPRKSARHRSLFESATEQALPYVDPFQRSAQHAGRSQREMRLANLCRLRPVTDTDRTSTLYQRRQVELFFKWIKQHLRIKSFFGTSENAVKTQIWIAVCVYVLVAIIKKRLNIKAGLYSILQILSLTIFETMTLDQLLTGCDQNMKISNDDIQLNLFDNYSGH